MQLHCTQCGDKLPGDARFCPRCGTPVLKITPLNAGTIAPTPAPVATEPFIGQVIADRYRIVERIAEGRTGTVYRAEHVGLGNRVAVKILHAQLTQDPVAVERFRREATTVGKIPNPHILEVLDFGSTPDGRMFIAMELLNGRSLETLLETTPQLPIEQVLGIAKQVADALMEAHGLGYVHRDLRPESIFLCERAGQTQFVKVLNFGLAKLVQPEGHTPQTILGLSYGDSRYMAPEQAMGDALDRRTDVYSLGAVMFQMLVGRPPYDANGHFEVLERLIHSPVPSVRVARPDCPEWLDAAVQKALAKKPDDRFVTVLRFLESLEQQRFEPSGPAPLAGPVPEPIKQKPTTLPLNLSVAPELAAAEPSVVVAADAAPDTGGVVVTPISQIPTVPTPTKPTAPAAATGVLSGTIRARKATPPPADVAPMRTLVMGSAPLSKTKSGQLEIVSIPTSAVTASDPVPSVVVDPRAEISPFENPFAQGATQILTPITPAKGTSPLKRDDTGKWFDTEVRHAHGEFEEDPEEEAARKARGMRLIIIVTAIGAVIITLVYLFLLHPFRAHSDDVAPSAAEVTPVTPPPAPAVVMPQNVQVAPRPVAIATPPAPAAAPPAPAAAPPAPPAAAPSAPPLAPPAPPLAPPAPPLAPKVARPSPAVAAAKTAAAAPPAPAPSHRKRLHQ